MNRCTTPNIAALILLLHARPGWAIGCEELRSEVEAKIRGAGVSQFTVAVVEAGTSSTGQVVGRCDRGNRKLIYRQVAASQGGGSSIAGAAVSTTRPPRPEAPIPIECKDGSISLTGRCKTP